MRRSSSAADWASGPRSNRPVANTAYPRRRNGSLLLAIAENPRKHGKTRYFSPSSGCQLRFRKPLQASRKRGYRVSLTPARNVNGGTVQPPGLLWPVLLACQKCYPRVTKSACRKWCQVAPKLTCRKCPPWGTKSSRPASRSPGLPAVRLQPLEADSRPAVPRCEARLQVDGFWVASSRNRRYGLTHPLPCRPRRGRQYATPVNFPDLPQAAFPCGPFAVPWLARRTVPAHGRRPSTVATGLGAVGEDSAKAHRQPDRTA